MEYYRVEWNRAVKTEDWNEWEYKQGRNMGREEWSRVVEQSSGTESGRRSKAGMSKKKKWSRRMEQAKRGAEVRIEERSI
jgi:hypothetical protein